MHDTTAFEIAFVAVLVIAVALIVSLVLSAIQVRFRDIGMAMPLLLQIWMFATPIVYPLSAVPAQWRSLYMLNPMVGVIDNVRRVLLHGTPPDLTSRCGALTARRDCSAATLFQATPGRRPRWR